MTWQIGDVVNDITTAIALMQEGYELTTKRRGHTVLWRITNGITQQFAFDSRNSTSEPLHWHTADEVPGAPPFEVPACVVAVPITVESPINTSVLPDPTQAQLETTLFTAIWQAIKTWDINVPGAYSGYTGAMGNHAAAIMNSIAKIFPQFANAAEAAAYSKLLHDRETLWQLLDDIDTLDDECKSNNFAYRESARRIAQKRKAVLVSLDGQTLTEPAGRATHAKREDFVHSDTDKEIEAMRTLMGTLRPLDHWARSRVLDYVKNRLASDVENARPGPLRASTRD